MTEHNSKETEQDKTPKAVLEAVGNVSAKFGHDFNNLLAAIQGCVELMKIKLDAVQGGNPCTRQLQLIEASITKGVALTDQMRGWVRSGELLLHTVALGQVVQSVVGLLAGVRPSATEIDVVVLDDCDASISEFHVRQALISIGTNAIEAMIGQSDRVLVMLVHKTDRGPAISVIDHGKGIALDAISQIFELHKKSDLGHGKLGISLAMVDELMRKMGGELNIRSASNIGTAVTLQFRSV